ncbi:MAG: RsmD family RNA methyltransferase, partial [Candidatus Komeilibacteria bacterium]|nr:RsmD family RNA methyltransferase [Candidatus Komeilibacteria bacterium]
MKHNYLSFLILGNLPVLSVAEVVAYLEARKISYDIVDVNTAVLLLRHDTAVDWSELGGVKKAGKICGESGDLNMSTARVLLEEHLPADKKIFGFSFYNLTSAALKRAKGDFEREALTWKKEWRAVDKIRVRLVKSRLPEMSSVIVGQEKLLPPQGMDVVIIGSGHKFFYGYTESIQDYRLYGERDFGKPVRDELRGMMPPKLARMMINYSQNSREVGILDPFCGVGTLPLEALSLGYKKIFAGDISPEAVMATQKNINWWKENNTSEATVDIKKADAREVSKSFPKNVRSIITEPYLGPLVKQSTTPVQAQKAMEELKNLYRQCFREWQRFLPVGGRVVMIWPEYHVQGSKLTINLDDKLVADGWVQIDYLLKNSILGAWRRGLPKAEQR